ncbi:MAG: glycosyl transferase, partial [Paramuribaculum sp.]|nr:glycosyl transferase [Paramuribaculum sp.]
MEGRNNSWAIRFCYHQFKKGLKSVHPFRSLVANEGYGLDATNCRQKYSRFQIDLDDSGGQLDIAPELFPDERILRQLRAYHSMPRRIYSRVRRILNV